jgi:hypothetical protein
MTDTERDTIARLIGELDQLDTYDLGDADTFQQAITDVCDLFGLPYPLITHVEDCDCDACADRWGFRRVEDVPHIEAAGL